MDEPAWRRFQFALAQKLWGTAVVLGVLATAGTTMVCPAIYQNLLARPLA